MFPLAVLFAVLADGAISVLYIMVLPSKLTTTNSECWMSIWMTISPVLVFIFAPLWYSLFRKTFSTNMTSSCGLAVAMASILYIPGLALLVNAKPWIVTIGVGFCSFASSLLWPAVYCWTSTYPETKIAKVVSFLEITTGIGRVLAGPLLAYQGDSSLVIWGAVVFAAAFLALISQLELSSSSSSCFQYTKEEQIPLLESNKSKNTTTRTMVEDQSHCSLSFYSLLLLLFLVQMTCGALDCNLFVWVENFKKNSKPQFAISLYNAVYLIASVGVGQLTTAKMSSLPLAATVVASASFLGLYWSATIWQVWIGLTCLSCSQAMLFVSTLPLLIVTQEEKEQSCSPTNMERNTQHKHIQAVQAFQLVPEVAALLSPWLYYFSVTIGAPLLLEYAFILAVGGFLVGTFAIAYHRI